MNLMLFNSEDVSDNRVIVTGDKLEHLKTCIKPDIGDILKVGIVGGLVGEGVVNNIECDKITLDVSFTDSSPEKLPLTLILAMPRPKVLNRVLQHAVSMGIKRIYIIKTWRVEKSYWDTPLLDEENLKAQCIIGLEQSRDTVLPEIHVRKLFKPFVEDELPQIIKGSLPVVAHPIASTLCPVGVKTPVTLAVGPEGGFIPYEVDALVNIGFTAVALGERILRVETVVPYLVGRMFC